MLETLWVAFLLIVVGMCWLLAIMERLQVQVTALMNTVVEWQQNVGPDLMSVRQSMLSKMHYSKLTMSSLSIPLTVLTALVYTALSY